MPLIDSLITAIQPLTIAQKVTRPIDSFRMAFSLPNNVVGDFNEYHDRVTEYYNELFTSCVSHGGRLSTAEAFGKVKAIIDRGYRSRNGDMETAFKDARDGENGGLRASIDLITDAVKTEAAENYVTEVFHRHLDNNDWEARVELIRQFIDKRGQDLDPTIRCDQPERYARDCEKLIRAYVSSLRETASLFRSC